MAEHPPVSLAVLHGYVSRPVAPTRRLALGALEFPTGNSALGSVLVAAIAAQFGAHLGDERKGDVLDLVERVDRGERLQQPAARHRLQTDRVGLTPMTYRLIRAGEGMRFAYRRDRSTPLQSVLLALYASLRMDRGRRDDALRALVQGLEYRGPVDADYLSEVAAGRTRGSFGDVEWARQVLGLAADDPASRTNVQRAYRQRLVQVHPDRGGSESDAAVVIAEIAEARRILLLSA